MSFPAGHANGVPSPSGRVADTLAKSVLDKDLKKVVQIEHATQDLTRSLTTPGLLILFLIGTVALASISVATGPLSYLVVIAALIAAYMALGIGANDVANNMGPAVGSRALTMGSALADRGDLRGRRCADRRRRCGPHHFSRPAAAGCRLCRPSISCW